MLKAVVLAIALAASLVLADNVCTLNASPDPIGESMDPVTISWEFDLSKHTPTALDVVAIYSPSSSKDSDYIGFEMLSKSPNWQSGSGSLTFTIANMRVYDYQFRIFDILPLPSTPFVSDETNQLIADYRRLRAVGSGKAVKLKHHKPSSHALLSTSDSVLPASGHGAVTRLCNSSSVVFANPNEPLQGHLALTDNAGELSLMFVSGDSTQSVVQYGSESGNYPYSSTGTTSTYAVTDMCGAPANTTAGFRNPGFIHRLKLTSLEANTRYYYRYGHSITENWSAEFSFLMHPPTNSALDPSTTTSVFAFGDLGETFSFQTPQEQYPAAEKSIQWMVQEAAANNGSQPHLVLHIGDLSYARGYAYQWEWFAAMTLPLATQYPYMVSIGNHEYDFPGNPFTPKWSDYGIDSGGECGVAYRNRFEMPTAGASAAAKNLWYSFNYGHFHFTIFSAEHDFLVGSEQWKWIESDLQSVDRSVTPWLIVASHRPWYSSSDPGTEAGLRQHLQDNIEPLLNQNKVDVYLAGHVHAYERSCGVSNNTCADRDEDAPVHLVIGMAGNDYQVPWIVNPLDSHRYPQPDWSIFRSLEYGFTHIEANATDFEMKFYTDQKRGPQVHDSFRLTKNAAKLKASRRTAKL